MKRCWNIPKVKFYWFLCYAQIKQYLFIIECIDINYVGVRKEALIFRSMNCGFLKIIKISGSFTNELLIYMLWLCSSFIDFMTTWASAEKKETPFVCIYIYSIIPLSWLVSFCVDCEYMMKSNIGTSNNIYQMHSYMTA